MRRVSNKNTDALFAHEHIGGAKAKGLTDISDTFPELSVLI